MLPPPLLSSDRATAGLFCIAVTHTRTGRPLGGSLDRLASERERVSVLVSDGGHVRLFESRVYKV